MARQVLILHFLFRNVFIESSRHCTAYLKVNVGP